jgi:hypothetical protein
METPIAKQPHMSYTYGPTLPIGSIRVLGLLPGQPEDPISCTLQTKTLDEADCTYDAISYCWGSEPEIINISCDGHSMLITPNLFDALQHFREPKNIRFLWADALCINQRNQIEKGHQVKRMASVYEKARQVMAWIGRDDGHLAEDCFALIRETVAYLDGVYISSQHRYFPPLEPASCPISTDQKRWHGVRALLAKDWFQRAWVVQEAGLGKSCVLNWGPHSILFVDVVELMYYIEWRVDLGPFTGDLGKIPAKILDSFSYIQSGFNNPQSWRTSRPVLSWRLTRYTSELFMNVILASRKLNASDRRDHVYAFLGSPMAYHQDGDLIVEPDYNNDKPPEDVFVEVAIALLAIKKEAPWVLLYVDHKSEDDLQAVCWPSWCPRWDPGPHGLLSENVYWYRAGGELNLYLEVDEGTRHLRLDGCIFDQVNWASELIQGDNFGFNPALWTSRCSRSTHIDDLWAALIEVAGRSDEDFYDSFLLCLVRALPFSQGLSNIDMDKVRANFRAYQNRFRSLGAPDLPNPPHEEGNIWGVLLGLLNIDNKRLILTKAGRLGMAPSLSSPNDVCCIVFGVANPLILRPSTSSPGSYNLVGGAYINDVMNGEVLEKFDAGDLKTETITLI